MNKVQKTKWAILGSSAMAILIVIFMAVSAKFTAERYESDIITADQRMQSVWSIMSSKIKMAGFGAKSFSKTFLDGIAAQAKRYENDKDGLMKWVKEAQSQLSPEVYTKLIDIIEKSYAKKAEAQANKQSLSNNYRKFLNGSIRGAVFAKNMGYPNTEILKIMQRTIQTEKTKEIFATGIDEEPEDPFAE